MKLLTIFQMIGVMAAYLGTILLLPWLLLRKRLAFLAAPARFFAYLMAGNFFCINGVFLLQFFNISNRATLIIGTLLPFLAVSLRGGWGAALERGSEGFRKFAEGALGPKTLLLRARQRLNAKRLGKQLVPYWPDILLTLGVIGLITYVYGTNVINIYGYTASDLLLHNSWINAMDSNEIFAAGIYPFGFHCVIYYLHQIFSIPTYVILRVFALTQTLMIHLVLLAFLKLVCKSRYTPYAGVIAYILTDAFSSNAYWRYSTSLPQEYGMLFILPTVYFLISFFREKDFACGKKGLQTVGDAKAYLLLFMMGVSMNIAIHFYDAVITAFLCLGVAVGYCLRCMSWTYLKRVLAAGIAGMLIAALPMADAYLTGVPLHGSWGWGVNVITGEENEAAAPPAAGQQEEAGSSAGLLGDIVEAFQFYVTNNSRAVAIGILVSAGLLPLLGILWYVLHKPDYAAILVAIGVTMLLLCLLQAADRLGLPQLLDGFRTVIYLCFILAVTWALLLDSLAYLLLRKQKLLDYGGLAALQAVCLAVVLTGLRAPVYICAGESNEEITCLTNILRENRGNTSWSVCSANNEQPMLMGRGYHYETVDFLREQRQIEQHPTLTIPTDTVYFFIEKVLTPYWPPANTRVQGQEVSLMGARAPLLFLSPKTDAGRWGIMSHMYYWAQAFQELYPNEMEVYFENENFVCYRIRQDGYTLYNFAIDYGYNH